MRRFRVAAVAILVLGAGCTARSWRVRFQDPLSPEEHVRLGETYQAQGFLEKAGEEFEKALRQQGRFVPALLALGDLAYEGRRYSEAQKYYSKALGQEPENARANNNLAMATLAQGEDLKEAERLVLKAAQKNDVYRPYALDTLANVYIEQERLEEAQTVLAEAEESAPADDAAFLDRLRQTRERLEVAFSR